MLLIATNRDELAADYLILRLREREIPFRRFNTEALGDTADLEISCDQQGTTFSLVIANQDEISPDSINGVYFHHALAPSGTVATISTQKEFADRELLETLRSLWRLIPEKLWLNHPVRLWRAANKLEQLVVATRCGLPIPDTLITRRVASVREFLLAHHDRVVVKAVRHGFVIGKDGMRLAGTQRIEPDYPDLMDRYAAVPAVYQEAITKHSDVRVVVVDRRVFAVQIIASGDYLDWRLADLAGHGLRYELIELPSGVERSCVDLVGEFGLRYSSMDLIRAQDGRFIFLELNPTGQWAWLEQITGCPIRDAIIDALIVSHE